MSHRGSGGSGVDGGACARRCGPNPAQVRAVDPRAPAGTAGRGDGGAGGREGGGEAGPGAPAPQSLPRGLAQAGPQRVGQTRQREE